MVGWLKKRQASARRRVEEKVAPVLAAALEPGEVARSSGLGLDFPRWFHIFLIGPLASLLMRQYWVVLTEWNLILIRLPNLSGPARLERVVPRASVRLIQDREGVLNRILIVDVDGRKHRFEFPFPYRSEGGAIAAAFRKT